MEDFILSFDYPRGHMNIVADKFFPCSKHDMLKLLKTIDLNPDYFFKREIGNRLKNYFRDRIGLLEDPEAQKEIANVGVDHRTKAVEMDEVIEKQSDLVNKMTDCLKNVTDNQYKRQYRESIKSEKEKLKDLKSIQREHYKIYKDCVRDLENCKKEAVRLKLNFETLEYQMILWE